MTIQLKQIDGKYHNIELNEITQRHFANEYNYTREILSEWESEPFKQFLAGKNNIVLDIGANVGLFAIHILPFVKKIVCLEPTPEHMEVQQLLLQDSKKEILHIEAALHNYTGKTAFHRCGINTTMNSLDYQNRSVGFEVNCLTLLDACKQANLDTVDLCKIDIEGSEVQALTVERIIEARDIVKSYLVELHPRTRVMQDRFKEIFNEAGYEVEYYDFNGSIYCKRK